MSRVSEQGEYFHLLVYSPQMAVGVRSSWVSQVGGRTLVPEPSSAAFHVH